MIQSNELRCFFEISWKIKAASMVFSQIRLEISKIWSGIPFLSRKKLGIDKVNNTFDMTYSLINDVLKNFNTLTYQYNRIYKDVIVSLQNVGCFINNQWTENLLEVRVEESNTITQNVDDLIKNISQSLNIKSNLNKDIDNPNIIDLFAINKSRIRVAEVIIQQSKEFLKQILDSANKANSVSDNTRAQIISDAIENINNDFEDFSNILTIIESYFDELTNDIIKTLKSVFIEVEIKSSREEEINQVIAYYDVADIYRMLRGMLKCENVFNRLLENKTNTNGSSSSKDDKTNENNINNVSESVGNDEVQQEKVAIAK